MKDQAAEATVAAVANASAKAGAGTVLFGWLTLNDFALVAGLVLTAVGVAVNFYYKRKAHQLEAEADRRAAELHAKLMAEDR